MKWIMILLLLFSFEGMARQKPNHKKSKMDLGMFTIQLYRLKLHESITVRNVTTDGHFYVVEGSGSDREAIFYLSRNILTSKVLSKFKIIDSILKFNGDKFKLYLKTENKKPDEDIPWVKVTPFSRSDFEKHMLLSGECHPNGRRVVLTGDIKGFADCISGQWSLKLRKLPSNRVFLFVQVSNTRGDIYLDGMSLVKTK